MSATIRTEVCLLFLSFSAGAVAQPDVVEAVADTDGFFERFDDELDSSTLGLYGLRLAAPGSRGLDSLENLVLDSELLIDAPLACLTLRSKDGRFEATNAYRPRPSSDGGQGIWELSPLTLEFERALSSIGTERLFAVGSLPKSGADRCGGAQAIRLPIVDRTRTPPTHLHAALNAEGRDTEAALDVVVEGRPVEIEGTCLDLTADVDDSDALVDRVCEFALIEGAYGETVTLRVRFGKSPFFDEPDVVPIRLPSRR